MCVRKARKPGPDPFDSCFCDNRRQLADKEKYLLSVVVGDVGELLPAGSVHLICETLETQTDLIAESKRGNPPRTPWPLTERSV